MVVDSALVLGDLVHERRTARGWSQGDLAQRMGVSRRWVNEFESGKGSAQLRLAFDALTVLGVVLEVRDEPDE
ncbi:putative transcriptional regulator [Curtobacterium sp. UNCCL20]|uniref:helix-turn-helix domain-containing protein n=1 Tax=Curtobacterium sp. UNCCL20 TaxID=1502773 RepID=UPI000887C972|nr:helix-turn-helix domain-containing protein [Curtobacterium sp. UNCCL20]SDQ20884.1 putative transcriptional regulator [Curtobacterium sp. UNCCL20]